MLQLPRPRLEAPADTAPLPDFLDALSTLASSVVLVTCHVDGRPWGMTVTAFCSISTAPPTVLVSLGAETAAAQAIARTDRFGVAVLGEEQELLARYGSRSGAAKHLEGFLDPRPTDSASPVVADAVSHLDCEAVDTVAVADHVLFLGRVRAAWSRDDAASPLLYHRRRFGRLGGVPTRAARGSG
jgi:flavin reductase (DIM6/NTAB) family NADH-FMN oxidoreductase RutF